MFATYVALRRLLWPDGGPQTLFSDSTSSDSLPCNAGEG